ncbi:hypothetical protein [Sulfobacillus thermosulfidooxidans]|uniref:hypothetical protein n=1 Tax=Sulfobacillus thermosulfidooxidans TaxID=28034 RepID=UPI000381C095|nr:hypothetical protein [Sulfobacillus thermosulfidooxidans]
MKTEYMGVVVDRSLKNNNGFKGLHVIRHRQVGSWGLMLVSVSDEEFGAWVKTLQNRMINIHDDCWYAHFFRDAELVVVYQDRVFSVTVDPSTWTDAVHYGIEHGIPPEQLDFHPRTVQDALSYFGVME